jgi:hypothetical protein
LEIWEGRQDIYLEIRDRENREIIWESGIGEIGNLFGNQG